MPQIKDTLKHNVLSCSKPPRARSRLTCAVSSVFSFIFIGLLFSFWSLESSTTFYKKHHTYVNWTFWLHKAYFLEENKQAWRKNMDEGNPFLYNVYTESIFTVVL